MTMLPLIAPVCSDRDLDCLKVIVRDYQAFLATQQDFQDFETELTTWPGQYCPPEGAFYLVYDQDEAVGCGAFVKLSEQTCEIKRLFVQPKAQGQGLGQLLLDKILDDARQVGYAFARLDSIQRLEKAARLYRRMGFYEIGRYNRNPNPDVYYLEKDLKAYPPRYGCEDAGCL